MKGAGLLMILECVRNCVADKQVRKEIKRFIFLLINFFVGQFWDEKVKKLKKELTVREIASIVGCSTTTVVKVRKVLEGRNELMVN